MIMDNATKNANKMRNSGTISTVDYINEKAATND